MCDQCWKEAGSPTIDNERVREAAEFVRQVYEFSAVAGNVHVMLDDWNLEDRYFEDDEYEHFIDQNVHEAGAEQLAVERRCLELFRAMTEAERFSALHRWNHTP